MKKAFYIFLLLFQFSQILQSQTSQELFHTSTIVVFGVDFSMAKILTDESTGKYGNDINSEIEMFNDAFVKRCLQYKKYFSVKKMSAETTNVVKVNSLVKPNKILTDGPNFISSTDLIKERIMNYKRKSNSNEVGMLLVMENIDELTNRMFFYVVFFEVSSGNVLVMDKMKIGISNQKKLKGSSLWDTGIMNILESMPKAYIFWSENPR